MKFEPHLLMIPTDLANFLLTVRMWGRKVKCSSKITPTNFVSVTRSSREFSMKISMSWFMGLFFAVMSTKLVLDRLRERRFDFIHFEIIGKFLLIRLTLKLSLIFKYGNCQDYSDTCHNMAGVKIYQVIPDTCLII